MKQKHPPHLPLRLARASSPHAFTQRRSYSWNLLLLLLLPLCATAVLRTALRQPLLFLGARHLASINK